VDDVIISQPSEQNRDGFDHDLVPPVDIETLAQVPGSAAKQGRARVS
jgi:hypothetical protein